VRTIITVLSGGGRNSIWCVSVVAAKLFSGLQSLTKLGSGKKGISVPI
jgi:hypothetical protein